MGIKWKLLIPLNAVVLAVMAATFLVQQRLVESTLLAQATKRLGEEVSFLARDIDAEDGVEAIRSTTHRFCMFMAHHESPRHQLIVEQGGKVVARGMSGKPRDLEDLLLSCDPGSRIVPYRNGRIHVFTERIQSSAGTSWTIRVSDDLAELDAQLAKLKWTSGASVSVVTAALLVVVNWLVHRLVTSPAAKLSATISEIGRGRFDVAFPEVRTREFSVISEALSGMAKALAEAEEKDQLAMEEASHIQQHILPPFEQKLPGLYVACRYRPCEKTGGDYCDVLNLDGKAWALVAADVTGHGVPAALTTTMLKVMLEHHLWAGRGVADSMADMSRDLARYLPHGRYASLFCAIYHPEKRTITYCNAGHPPPLLLRPSGNKPIFLDRGGTLLGVLPPEELPYHHGEEILGGGDRLILFTDGVTEQRNARHEIFGVDRLVEICRDGMDLPLMDLLDRILEEVAKHAGSVPQQDDITLLAAGATG